MAVGRAANHGRPPGGAFDPKARYANWQSGEAQTFVTCGFDSHPCYCNARIHASVGHWQAPVAVTHPPLLALQVRLLERRPEDTATRPVRLEAGFQALNLGRRVQFPHGSLTDTTKWWNVEDTRRSERRALRRGSSNLPLVTRTGGQEDEPRIARMARMKRAWNEDFASRGATPSHPRYPRNPRFLRRHRV
jgi:hypothetical protein